jgi:hypothetical protein
VQEVTRPPSDAPGLPAVDLGRLARPRPRRRHGPQEVTRRSTWGLARPRPRPGVPGGYPAIDRGHRAAAATTRGPRRLPGDRTWGPRCGRGLLPKKIPASGRPSPPRPAPAGGAWNESTARRTAGVTRPSPSGTDGAPPSEAVHPPSPGHPSRSRPRPRSSTGAQKDGPTPHSKCPPSVGGPAGPVSTDKSRQHGLTLNSS